MCCHYAEDGITERQERVFFKRDHMTTPAFVCVCLVRVWFTGANTRDGDALISRPASFLPPSRRERFLGQWSFTCEMPLARQSSGIKSVKRDFTSNNEPSSSRTTVVQRAPLRNTGVTNGRSLTDQEKRLKAIQDALRGMPDADEPTIVGAGHKRAAPSVIAAPGPAKRRQLPSSWSQESSQPQKPSRMAAAASFNRQLETVTEITAASGHKSSARPAAVFLSQEQTHILKLVEQGESLFYTGSAGQCILCCIHLYRPTTSHAGTGKSVLLREIIKVLKKKYAISADSVAVTASTGRRANLESISDPDVDCHGRHRCLQHRRRDSPLICWHRHRCR